MVLSKYVAVVLLTITLLMLSAVSSKPTIQFAGGKSDSYPIVELKWIPTIPAPGQEVTFELAFINPGTKMPRIHVTYNFTITKEESIVYAIEGHTYSGTETLQQTLESVGDYIITVSIKAIALEPVDPRSSEFFLTVEEPPIQLPKEEPFIPRGETPLKIEGRWTTKTEWIDASETEIRDNGLLTYLRAKHDGTFVYILIDFISDHGVDKSSDFAIVCFDTRGNGGHTPSEDDYCFYRITRTGKFADGIIQGNGVDWTILQEARTWDPYEEKFKAAIGHSNINNPYDSVDAHVIYEYRIPIEPYGLQEMMKFYVYANDAYVNKFVEWPADAGGKPLKLIVKDVLPPPDEWSSFRLELNKPSDLSLPTDSLEEELEEETIGVKVQAEQIKNLVIVRLRNIDGSTLDIHSVDILLPDSLLKAYKGPREWSKESLKDNGATFSTLNKPIRSSDKAYFLFKVEGISAQIVWTVYGPDKSELSKGSVPLQTKE